MPRFASGAIFRPTFLFEVRANFWLEQRRRSPRARTAAWISTAVVCSILVCPTPTTQCLRFYGSYYSGAIAEARSRSKKIYLAQHVRGYRESQAVIETLTSNGQRKSRVLVFGRETPAFYFRREHIKSVGDYFGPARLNELIAEIQRGDCRPYLDRLHVSAIIIDPKVAARSPALYTKFRRELELNHFVEYRCGNDPVPVFLKSDMAPSQRLTRVTHDPTPLTLGPRAERIWDRYRVS